MPTIIDPVGVTPRQKKEVRVEFTAHAILNQNGRGVPVFKGSVLDVDEHDAALLMAANKAKKAPGKDVVIAKNEDLNQTPKKAS